LPVLWLLKVQFTELTFIQKILHIANLQNGRDKGKYNIERMKHIITYIFFLTTFVCFGTTTKVTRVIDGDTFETETGEKVRLIGINAPEISDIFGQESKQHLENLILNKTISLEVDNLSGDRDRYQRLLRYVLLEGDDINEKMLLDGFAFAYLRYDFNNSNKYEQAQLYARENNRGIWGGSDKDGISNLNNYNSIKNIETLSTKTYIIGSLIFSLLLVWIYVYFKK
jgi:micrococcal nuclease